MKNIIFALLITIILPANSLAGEELKVAIKTTGLAAPFITYGLEKKLGRLKGVKGIVIKARIGKVTVTFADKKFYDKEGLEKLVKEAGFTPKSIRKIKK